MSMSKDYIQEVLEKPAVSCCRTEVGTMMEPSNLEDPAIFPDLEESGLLSIPDNCLKIKDVLGGILLKTIDSLVPITSDILKTVISGVDSVTDMEVNENEFAVLKIGKKSGEILKIEDFESAKNLYKLQDSLIIDLNKVVKIKDALGKKILKDIPALTGILEEDFGEKIEKIENVVMKNNYSTFSDGILKIRIGEGKNIDIELPLTSSITKFPIEINQIPDNKIDVKDTNVGKKLIQNTKNKRTLIRKYFKIEKVEFGPRTEIIGETLYIRKDIKKDAISKDHIATDLEIDIITMDKYKTYSDTIMDVQPIATKEGDSKLGMGITRVLDGVVIMITGTDEKGVQIGEFGSSEGILEENIAWGRPGAPDKGEIIIKVQVTIKAGTNMERPGPFAAHTVTDFITQEIREALKKIEDSLSIKKEELVQCRRPDKKKIVIVKEIMGQGAMHDNLILPIEPVGVLGGKPNVDLGNIPIMLSPLEVLDGGIHALTCIGPASKECSRHYFREPLVIDTMNDEELDLCGVIFIGSPQVNSEKFYVSERLGAIVESLDVEGAIVTTEGFGNNHIDFANHMEQIGMRGIPVVGMTFSGVQGALVVGNKYMNNMIDNNKSAEGIENEILACNTLCHEDAIRALEMLKAIMANDEISEAERKWNSNVKENNIEVIENSLKVSIERADII